MKYDEFIHIVSDDVSQILGENIENILKKIVEDIDFSSTDENTIKMCKNTVTISTQLSCQIIFDVLDSLGMLCLENLSHYEQVPKLHLIKGGLPDEKPNG